MVEMVCMYYMYNRLSFFDKVFIFGKPNKKCDVGRYDDHGFPHKSWRIFYSGEKERKEVDGMDASSWLVLFRS